MLIQFFKRNHPSQVFFILLFGLLLTSLGIFKLQSPVANYTSVPYQFVNKIVSYHALVNKIFSVSFIIFQSLLFNRIINNNDVINNKTYLPALFFSTFSLLVPSLQTVHPVYAELLQECGNIDRARCSQADHG